MNLVRGIVTADHLAVDGGRVPTLMDTLSSDQ